MSDAVGYWKSHILVLDTFMFRANGGKYIFGRNKQLNAEVLILPMKCTCFR